MRRPRWSLRRARALVGTKFLLIAGLIGFVVVAWLVELIAGLREPVNIGPLIAALMAAIPAAFWLGFFYLLDRHEHEPKQLVVGVAVLGALVAAPLSDFLHYQLVPPLALEIHSARALSLERVVEAVLIIGLVQEICKYAVVRYTIYNSPQFDDPLDGIVYMMACGAGFAVWDNYHRLSGQGHQVIVSAAAANAVITTLAHASFAGALGYVMGRAKFSRRSPLLRAGLLFLGLLGAAVLNGQFRLVENWIQQSGMGTHPMLALGYALLSASLVFGAIWFASQHLLNRRRE